MPTKEAVVLIPGFFAKAQGDYLEQLLAPGLTGRLERCQVEMATEPIKIAGQTGRRFTVHDANQAEKQVDVYEVYWLDLIDKFSEKSLKDQIFRGFYLLLYWLLSKYWVMGKQSKVLVVQFVINMGLVALWYYGTVAIALTAIGQNPAALGVAIPPDWAKVLSQIGDAMGNWSVWIVVSLFMGLLPISINSLVNILDFSTRYIEDDISLETGSIRDRIRLRIKAALDDVLQDGDYERVTVACHSMGVAIAIDLLADYYNPTAIPIRLISMGGMIELFSYKVQWIADEAKRCLKNTAIQSWTDYYSKQDWLCTKTPTPDGADPQRFTNHCIQFRVPWIKQLLGETHVAYFYDQQVLEDVLGL